MTGYVQRLSAEVVVDGRRTVVEFHRAEKIADILADKGSLGEFFRDMVSAAMRKSAREDSAT